MRNQEDEKFLLIIVQIHCYKRQRDHVYKAQPHSHQMPEMGTKKNKKIGACSRGKNPLLKTSGSCLSVSVKVSGKQRAHNYYKAHSPCFGEN